MTLVPLMLERDLQDYLYQHPDTLFPGQVVQEKQREYSIQGKRIDLLFRVDGVRYIVELKRNTIERDHIGQIVEYYGLMREALHKEQIRMILVAPKIPAFRKVYLEELGIRCVEVPMPLEAPRISHQLMAESVSYRKAFDARQSLDHLFPEGSPISYSELSQPATPLALAMTHRVLRDSLESVRRAFSGYETVPIRMVHPNSPDQIAWPAPVTLDQTPRFLRGGAWWAYAFGQSDTMPKNDVPNISIASMPGSLDLTVNSELQTSQRVLISQITKSPAELDRLLQAHGGLDFQACLKLEHQPRFYHWIPISVASAGTWDARHLLSHYKGLEVNFKELREKWITWLKKHRPDLTSGQSSHLEKSNRSLNVALRLVRPFGSGDPLWKLDYTDQVRMVEKEIIRLKPFIDFFVGSKTRPRD
jgi:hypothetical protein